MKEKTAAHTFHIPVMGTGYTLDTPFKVAHLGINSVISIIDHKLIEQMREYLCKMNEIHFTPIPLEDADYRAKCTTAYLNLLNNLVQSNFEKLKKNSFEPNNELTKYFELLPDTSSLKAEYNEMLQSSDKDIGIKQARLKEKMYPGEIHVNIMTKLDRANYSKDNEPLPVEFNDAHASLRGFAISNLNSSIVLSAGLNPRLFGYMANFDSFYPDADGQFKKKIILKVSDYRSAIIQGKMLAKKGLWVSEFRIESGLNCGGHAFATEGYLMGPILNEFKENKTKLIDELFEIFAAALRNSNKVVPSIAPVLTITAQGGVGTYEEHKFLLDYYEVDSVGWGSPFLLVPDVVNIDKESMDLIANADERGFYLSNISPLGVLFNTVRGNSGEVEKQKKIDAGKPGAPCAKKHLLFNTEFTEKPICSASRQYQKFKIAELDLKNLNTVEYEKQLNSITDKVCLCVSLGNSTLIKNEIEMLPGIHGVSVCPGPNMAYFSKIATLKEMVDHIYGRSSLIKRTDRPNMFIQELNMYVVYLKSKVEEYSDNWIDSQIKYYQGFQKNLNDGINYYSELFSTRMNQLDEKTTSILNNLSLIQSELNNIKIQQLQTVVC